MFNCMMHVALFTENFDEMVDFYVNKMGGKAKSITRFEVYKGKNRGYLSQMADEHPNWIFNEYIEMAPGQFLEIFPGSSETMGPVIPMGKNLGYSHFAFTCDDIFKTREELEAKGVVFDTEISKGPSETYQMWTHDPDGNAFEIMQYTENSLQVLGNV